MAMKELTKKEIIENIDSSIDGAESLRSEGLERAKMLQSIKTNMEERRLKQQKKKLGDAHPRVKILEAKAAFRKGAVADMDVELNRTKIAVPAFDADTWMVHGRVLNKERQGVKDLTVALYDKAGKWIRELGYSCTDTRGYFSISAKKDKVPADLVTSGAELCLHVTGKDGKLMAKDPLPLTIAFGQVEYREILINGDGGVCRPPEPDDGGPTRPVPDRPQPQPAPGVNWGLKGRVTGLRERPLAGATVNLKASVRGQDYLIDSVTADENGGYKFNYSFEKLSKRLKEKFDYAPRGRASFVLEVVDPAGNSVAVERKVLSFKAGDVETLDIKVGRTPQ